MPVDFVAERRCPECGQDSDEAASPFCSDTCRRAFEAATVAPTTPIPYNHRSIGER